MEKSVVQADGVGPATAGGAGVRMWGLIACAGSGSRAGDAGPKQYRMLAGRSLVEHTLRAFEAVSRLEMTLVVLAPGDRTFAGLQLALARCQTAFCGGATRAASVYNGLRGLLAGGALAHDWVLVHDAARCLIQPQDIDRLIDACLTDEVGGLLALPVPDTLKQMADGRVVSTLERRDKWLAQTPQMFRIGSLVEALELTGEAVTDESSAIEAMGLQPRLVTGSAENLKVTYAQDFVLAELILHSRQRSGARQE